MAKTSGELEQEFIEAAKVKTGKSMQEWLNLVKSSGISGNKNIHEWLKKGHGLNHMQAQFVTGIYLNGGNPVYVNKENLLDSQFAKYPGMRELFDLLSEKILSTFTGTQLIPKKTYISFTAVREFAAVNIKQGEIRLGLDLGEEPFSDYLQKSKLSGPMARISHMIIFTVPKQLDKKLLEKINLSYYRTHTK